MKNIDYYTHTGENVVIDNILSYNQGGHNILKFGQLGLYFYTLGLLAWIVKKSIFLLFLEHFLFSFNQIFNAVHVNSVMTEFEFR